MSLFCRFNQFFGILFLGSSLKQCFKVNPSKISQRKKKYICGWLLDPYKESSAGFSFYGSSNRKYFDAKRIIYKRISTEFLKILYGVGHSG